MQQRFRSLAVNVLNTFLGYQNLNKYIFIILFRFELIHNKGVSGNGVSNHKTSPFVRVGCEATKEFIGGASEFISYSREVSIVHLRAIHC